MKQPTFDSDGYPTESTLRAVRRWECKTFADCTNLLVYVRMAWRHESYFTVAKRRHRSWKGGQLHRRYHISTAGWSGNEDLMAALRKNWAFWMLCWQEHRRGGHYIFEVPEP